MISKKELLSAKLVSKPGQPESIENDQNINTVRILQEKQCMTCEAIAVSTNILKTLIFLILRNNLPWSYEERGVDISYST